ncbi:MAG TPA: DUF1016 N-terminal domain-containing protein [Polyangia bacterium]
MLDGYEVVLGDVVGLLEGARRSAVRAVNAAMTATYYAIGRRLVEEEQRGQARAGYGEALVERLATDLAARFGRGFGRRNLFQMRAFYLAYREKVQTLSAQSPEPAGDGKVQMPSALSPLPSSVLATSFPLPWSHYVRLLALRDPEARSFYEAEALRGGWTHRQLDRQVAAVARYALEGLPNKVLAAEYRTTLPAEKTLAAEVRKARRLVERKAR